MIDYDRFVKACNRWKYADTTLEITFRPGRWLPKYIEEAAFELLGYEYERAAGERPDTFYAECVALVEKRDSELRSKVLAMVKQEDQKYGASKAQLTLFD